MIVQYTSKPSFPLLTADAPVKQPESEARMFSRVLGWFRIRVGLGLSSVVQSEPGIEETRFRPPIVILDP